MGLTRTLESKVMAVWIFRDLTSSVSSVSIYYAPESEIRVKSYDLLNFSRASMVHFRVSRYIMGLTHTPESKVMAVWICRELPCSMSSVSIYYAPESDIRVKCYDPLNFSRASTVHFRASRYIMCLTHISESKVMDVWICRELTSSISSVSTYCAPESEIGAKSYDLLNFSRACMVHFRVSQNITGRTHTPDSKVMDAWIFWELLCTSSSISIYYLPELESRVKTYDHLNFSRASVVQFRVSWYFMDLKHTWKLKVIALWIFWELPCTILRVSIYYEPQSNIRVKCYDVSSIGACRTWIFFINRVLCFLEDKWQRNGEAKERVDTTSRRRWVYKMLTTIGGHG